MNLRVEVFQSILTELNHKNPSQPPKLNQIPLHFETEI